MVDKPHTSLYTEATRPAMYRALKYWGKKPHNIWNEIIRKYSKTNDVVFDPFAGSGLTFFEGIRAGRIPVVDDMEIAPNDFCSHGERREAADG